MLALVKETNQRLTLIGRFSASLTIDPNSLDDEVNLPTNNLYFSMDQLCRTVCSVTHFELPRNGRNRTHLLIDWKSEPESGFRLHSC